MEKWLKGITSLSLIIRVRMNRVPIEAVRDNQTQPCAHTLTNKQMHEQYRCTESGMTDSHRAENRYIRSLLPLHWYTFHGTTSPEQFKFKQIPNWIPDLIEVLHDYGTNTVGHLCISFEQREPWVKPNSTTTSNICSCKYGMFMLIYRSSMFAESLIIQVKHSFWPLWVKVKSVPIS